MVNNLNTPTDIANHALQIISEDAIASIDGAERVAEICSRFFWTAVDHVIFLPGELAGVVERATLVPYGEPEGGFKCSYQFPNRFLAGLRLESGLPYATRAGRLFTNDGAAVLFYKARPQNFGGIPTPVKEFFGACLATMIVGPVTGGDERKIAVAEGKYRAARSSATSASADVLESEDEGAPLWGRPRYT